MKRFLLRFTFCVTNAKGVQKRCGVGLEALNAFKEMVTLRGRLELELRSAVIGFYQSLRSAVIGYLERQAEFQQRVDEGL